MTETEEADLKLRAETAEALLAAEREENERLRAELAVALGQKPETKKLEINRINPNPGTHHEIDSLVDFLVRTDLEEKARTPREIYDKMSPPKQKIDRMERGFLAELLRGMMAQQASAERPRVRVDRSMTRDELTVVIRKSGYNVAFDVTRQDALREQSFSAFVRRHVHKAMDNLYESLENRPANASEVEWAYEEVMRQTRRVIGMRQHGHRQRHS